MVINRNIRAMIYFVILALYITLMIYLKTLAFGDRVANNMPADVSWLVVAFYSCYYEFIIIGLSSFLLTAISLTDKVYLKILAVFTALLVNILFLVDVAAKTLFNQRILFEQLFGFGKDTSYFIDFIVYYLFYKHEGQISVVILVLIGVLIWQFFKKNISVKTILPTLILALVLLIGGGILRLSPPQIVLPYYFINNLYQINRSSDELYYSENFRFPPDWQLNYIEKAGPDMAKKNIILLFVESLDFGLTEEFTDKPLVPNIESLSKEGINYTNYFSNNNNSSDARFTILTGHPKLNGPVSYRDKHYYEHSFIDYLNKKGFHTALFTAAPDLYGSASIFENAAFKQRVTFEDPVYQNEQRYVFKSVSDEAMLNNLVRYTAGKFSQPFFAMAITATTHSPYQIPGTDEYSIDGCIKYTDAQVASFVEKLRKQNFFENGILIITGDHHSMRPVSKKEIREYGLYQAAHRVPLIVLGNGVGTINDYLDHASLGVLISYWASGYYECNRFQYDPLNVKDRLILAQPYFLQDTVLAFDSTNNQSYKVHLDGDDTAFNDERLNSTYSDYLYYIAWLRQNFAQ